MSTSRVLSFATLSLPLIGACIFSGPGDLDVDLLPGQMSEAQQLGLLHPESGGRFVVIPVEVRNRLEDQSIAAVFQLFSVVTDGGLEIIASPASIETKTPCSINALITPGHSFGCDVAFDVPSQDRPAEIRYTGPDGRKVAARLLVPIAPTPVCDRCDGVCVDLATDPKNCGKCGRTASPIQECKEGAVVCLSADTTPCGTDCPNLKTDPKHCGGCNKPVGPGTTCLDGKEACASSTQTMCGDTCVNLKADDSNCGQCNRVCPQGGLCSLGTSCTISEQINEKISCNSYCTNLGYKCTSAKAIYVKGGAGKGYALTCAMVPPSTHPSDPSFSFAALDCECTLKF